MFEVELASYTVRDLEAATSSTSPHLLVPVEEAPDFSFIDEIYESVKAEINAEKVSPI